MKNNFERIESLAKNIYLTLIKENGHLTSENQELLSELSKQAYKSAQIWFDLEYERLQLFYSRKENRLDWYKEKTMPRENVALNTNPCKEDIGLSAEHYGTYHWVTRYDNDNPVYAEFVEFDDGFYKFKDPKSEEKFKINSILISESE